MERTGTSLIIRAFDKQCLSRQRKEQRVTRPCSSTSVKRRYRTCTGRLYSRVLQQAISSAQKREPVETCHRLVQPKSLYSLPKFQDGDGRVDKGFSEVRRMDQFYRPLRCVLPHSLSKGSEEVLSVSGKREGLPVSSHAVRTGLGSTSFHRIGEGTEAIGSDSQFPSESVSGRLDKSLPVRHRGVQVCLGTPKIHGETRVPAKLREVGVNTVSMFRLSGIPFRPREGFGVPNFDKGGEDPVTDGAVSQSGISISQDLAIPDRSVSLSNEGSSRQSPVAKEPPVGSKSQVEILHKELFGHSSSDSSRGEENFEVVPGSAEFVVRLAASPSNSRGPCLHGRERSGLGRTLPPSTSSRGMDTARAEPTHQCVGIEGGDKVSKSLFTSDKRQSDSSSIGQCHCGGISTKVGGCSCLVTEHSHQSLISLGQKAQDHNSGQAYSRVSECVGRSPLKKGSDSTNRVVSEPSGVSEDNKAFGLTPGRSFRHKRKCQVTSLCQPHSRSKRNGRRRHVNVVEGSGCLRVSSDASFDTGLSKSSKRAMQTPVDSSSVASSSLVLGASSLVSGQTVKAASVQNSPSPTSRGFRPKHGNEKFARVVDKYRALRRRGFSKRVVERVCAPQRSSTRAVYRSKHNMFKYWCSDHGVDAVKPSLAQLSNFFMFLFDEKKLAPGTIQAYRTALADFIPDSVLNIRESEELTRLMKSFFRDRPRSNRSLLPWDLRVVLDSLSKSPFEPLKKATLKHLTQKTVFLLALATGRRCGDIRALSYKRLKWRESDGALQLFTLPAYLPKNLKASDPSAFLKPIFIPSLGDIVGPVLEEDALNCPLRCVSQYLSATSKLRDGKELLFVATKPSCKEICVNTISAWIKGTITDSYKYYNERVPLSKVLSGQVRAHDVRGLAASWAAKGNVSLEQILDACFWKSKNTFISFYLKDVWIDSSDHFSLSPFVAAQNVLVPSEAEHGVLSHTVRRSRKTKHKKKK